MVYDSVMQLNTSWYYLVFCCPRTFEQCNPWKSNNAGIKAGPTYLTEKRKKKVNLCFDIVGGEWRWLEDPLPSLAFHLSSLWCVPQLTAWAVCEQDSPDINTKGKKEDLGTTDQSASPGPLERWWSASLWRTHGGQEGMVSMDTPNVNDTWPTWKSFLDGWGENSGYCLPCLQQGSSHCLSQHAHRQTLEVQTGWVGGGLD